MARRSPEQMLLSSIINTGDIQTAYARGVNSSWFHIHEDDWLWIEKYYSRNKKVPSRAAMSQAREDFRIVAGAQDVGHYSDETRDSHLKFSIMGIARDAIESAGMGDVQRALSTMHSESLRIASTIQDGEDSDVLSSYDDVLEALESRYRRVQASGMAGMPTGFSILDSRSGGPQPGHVWVVAARSGEGKSWTMIRMGAACALAGYNVHFNALEMMRPEVAARLHSFLMRGSGKQVFDSMNVLTGKDYSIIDYKKAVRSLGNTISGRFHVADGNRGRLSASTVAAQVERHKPDIVFIDYITLMEMGGGNDWQDIGALMADLKGLATTYGIPVVVAAQINRQGIGKSPAGIEALGRSDSIGQDADAVITMKKISPSVMKYKMAKFRHGPDGYSWWAEFNAKNGVLEEIDKNKAMDLRDQDAIVFGDSDD